jgi:hypothetical protein
MPGFVLKLIVLPSAPLVQNRLLPAGFLLLFWNKKLSGNICLQPQLIENILLKICTNAWQYSSAGTEAIFITEADVMHFSAKENLQGTAGGFVQAGY